MEKNDSVYENLSKFLDTTYRNRSNALIITLPGFGLSHELIKYIKTKGINYITNLEDKVDENNIIDIDANRYKSLLKDIETHYHKNRNPSPKNTFIYVLNTPYILDTPEYKTSFISSHIHQIYYFKTRTYEETEQIFNQWGYKLDKKAINDIYSLTGGITRLLKYFTNNPEKITSSLKSLSEDEIFINLIRPTIREILRTKERTLDELNITNDGKYLSSLVRDFVSNQTMLGLDLNIDIRIENNIDIYENNILNKNSFSEFEINLISELVLDSFLTRDKLAQIKWGNDYLDKYSDEAITKAVSRLNEKLLSYQITAYRGKGYRLIKL